MFVDPQPYPRYREFCEDHGGGLLGQGFQQIKMRGSYEVLYLPTQNAVVDSPAQAVCAGALGRSCCLKVMRDANVER